MKMYVAHFVALMAVLMAGGAMAQQAPYVVDADNDALIRVDPVTGDRTVVSGCADAGCTTLVGTPAESGFSFARGIFFEPDGNILVCDGDLDDLNNIKTLFRVDPVTGNRTVVSSSLLGSEVGTGPVDPLDDDVDTLFDVILDANGDILVADTEVDTIFRVDPVTGDRTVLSSNRRGTGPPLSFPGDMVLDADGSILITEGSNDQVLRVDPVSGDRVIVSSSVKGDGIALKNLGGITLDANGGILVADELSKAVIAIDPGTGDRTTISGCVDDACTTTRGIGPAFVNTFSIDIDSAGTIYVADGALGLIKVDPGTGERVVLSSSTVGAGMPPITLLRDVRMEPAPAPPLPVSSPFTIMLMASFMLGTAGFVLARKSKSQA